MFIFAAVAFCTVAVQVQTVVGEANTVSGGNLTLARFDGIIAKLDHFAAVQANQVIVMVLLRQFKNGFTAFEIMTGDDTSVVKLVQYAVDGGPYRSGVCISLPH